MDTISVKTDIVTRREYRLYKKRVKQRRNGLDKYGHFGKKYKEGIIIFLMSFTRYKLDKPTISISPHIFRYMFLPYIQMGYFIQYMCEELIFLNRPDTIEKSLMFNYHMIGHNFYYLNKKLLSLYNFNFRDEYYKYFKIFYIFNLGFHSKNYFKIYKILKKCKKEDIDFILLEFKNICIHNKKELFIWEQYCNKIRNSDLVTKIDPSILN